MSGARPLSGRLSDRRPIADVFRATARAAVRSCRRFGISANQVSAASLVAGIGGGLAFATLPAIDDRFASPAAVLIVIAIGVGLSLLRLWLNMLDGMVALAAQSDGTQSDATRSDALGALWNEAPDRLSDIALLIGVAHSGLCQPLLGYGAALAALAVAYVGTLGQALGAGRRFEGWMSKPWRVVTVLVGIALAGIAHVGVAHLAVDKGPVLPYGWTPLDIALLVVVLGAIDTIRRRLGSIFETLSMTGDRSCRP